MNGRQRSALGLAGVTIAAACVGVGLSQSSASAAATQTSVVATIGISYAAPSWTIRGGGFEALTNRHGAMRANGMPMPMTSAGMAGTQMGGGGRGSGHLTFMPRACR